MGCEERVSRVSNKNVLEVACLASATAANSKFSLSSMNFLHDDNLNNNRG